MLLVALLVFRALSGPAAVCAGGWRPARWPSAPRASLGASSFLRVLLVAPWVFRAPEGPAARETRRLRFARRRVSKPDRALRSLRRPPHRWRLVADWRVVSEPGQAPSSPHRCRVHTSLAALLAFSVQRVARLKPLSPLWPGLCAWVKPLSPLLARNVCFCGVVGEQRCRWFQGCPWTPEQWCHGFRWAATCVQLFARRVHQPRAIFQLGWAGGMSLALRGLGSG